MDEPIWVPGRALVYDEAGEVEYFMEAVDVDGIRFFLTACGGQREAMKCRPLEYVMRVNWKNARHYYARRARNEP